ncbi:hypothetical protein Pint_31576 [Pistacia integerrima]|uniref:Uncharacterized protein n=1 Tax=Pistacia integerrima TaxID=434235 RepID=A0ACC0XPM2_9ROSI|nr:hypothetical protein Pint_31576 [Pistacia integerrima]
MNNKIIISKQMCIAFIKGYKKEAFVKPISQNKKKGEDKERRSPFEKLKTMREEK